MHLKRRMKQKDRQVDLYKSKQRFYIGVNLKEQRPWGKGVRNVEVSLMEEENSQ